MEQSKLLTLPLSAIPLVGVLDTETTFTNSSTVWTFDYIVVIFYLRRFVLTVFLCAYLYVLVNNIQLSNVRPTTLIARHVYLFIRVVLIAA